MLVWGLCIYRLLKACLWMDLALICVLIHPWENLGMFCVLISATFPCLAEIYRAFLPILWAIFNSCLFCEDALAFFLGFGSNLGPLPILRRFLPLCRILGMLLSFLCLICATCHWWLVHLWWVICHVELCDASFACNEIYMSTNAPTSRRVVGMCLSHVGTCFEVLQCECSNSRVVETWSWISLLLQGP